jgi:hypothetical protein
MGHKWPTGHFINLVMIVSHHNMARPTKYKPECNKRAYELAFLGATNEMIASGLNINPDTFYTWIKKYPAFAESIEQGKAKVDGNAVRSLRQRALGYTTKETTTTTCNGKETTITVERYKPPDVRAIIFWLCNRQRQEWRRKPVPPPPPRRFAHA